MSTRALTLAGLSAATIGATAAPTTANASTTKKYAGATEETHWGPVSVTITVKSKKITAISVRAIPHTPRSEQLQSFSIPVLKQEALKAQTYNVHIVSGATVTSEGFIASLHSAMIRARL